MGKKVFIVKENMMCADDTEQKDEQTHKTQKDTCHTNEFCAKYVLHAALPHIFVFNLIENVLFLLASLFHNYNFTNLKVGISNI